MPEHNSTTGLLTGRKMLVIGAARSPRLAPAKSIAEADGVATLTDILGERVQEKAVALRAAGFGTYGLTLDLDDPVSIQTYATATAQALGGLDGSVNNMVVTNSDGHDAPSIGIETQDRVAGVNMHSTWLTVMACLSALKVSGRGAIVNLSSDTPLWDMSSPLAHVAGKGTVIGMTRSLMREYGADGIIVNAIAPGLTLMEATEYAPTRRHALYRDRRVISRDQLPDDMCGTVLLTLSDLSRFVMGRAPTVNGGFVIQQCIHTPFRRSI